MDAIKILMGYGFYVSIFFTVLLCLSSPVYADGQRNEVYSAASILSQFDEKSMLEHGEMNSFVVSMTGNLGVVLGVSMTMSGGRWGSNWSDVSRNTNRYIRMKQETLHRNYCRRIFITRFPFIGRSFKPLYC